MSRLSWWLIERAARLLDRGEREPVLGDIAESEGRLWQALTDVLGLALRNQLASWHDWRPWLALLGVAGIAGMALSRIVFALTVALGLQIRTWQHFGVRYESGRTVEEELVYLACLFLVAILCSWASGTVLVSLSGRTVWATGTVFYLVVAGACREFFMLSGNLTFRGQVDLLEGLFRPNYMGLIAWVIPAFSGAYLARTRNSAEPRLAATALAAVATLTGAAAWANRSGDTASIWLFSTAASTPLAWLCARGRRKVWSKGEQARKRC